MRPAEFYAELKRRHVLKVMLIYATGTWVLIQVADVLFEAFEIENWIMQVLVAVTFVGFPIVAFLSWFFDWTKRGGVEITDVKDAVRLEQIRSAPSIAVLPFEDLSPNQDYEYFSHGIAEEITIRLSKLSWLEVAARTSAFGMRRLEQDVHELGKKLDVSTILDGSVRAAGDDIRVSVQLMNVETGLTLWAERFDGKMDDVFRIQDSMAESVVATLSRHLGSGMEQTGGTEEGERIEKDAYNLFLKARYHYNKATSRERDDAAQLYSRVIELAPDYVPAYSGLAMSRALALIGGVEINPPHTTMPIARNAALKALELNPSSADARAALAWITFTYDWDFEKGAVLFDEALATTRNVTTLFGSALYQNCAGHLDKAIELIEEAVSNEPLSLIALSGTGRFYRYAREYDKSIAACREMLALDPSSKAAVIGLFETYFAMGDLDAAEQTIVSETEISSKHNIGVVFHRGRLGGMRRNEQAVSAAIDELTELARTRYVPPFMQAVLHLTRADVDGTFHWLEEGVKGRDAYLIDLLNFRLPKFLTGDPRFERIIQGIGIDRIRSRA